MDDRSRAFSTNHASVYTVVTFLCSSTLQKIYTPLYLRYEPQYIKCSYGDTFCQIFLHQLVNATPEVVKTLPDVLCSSRDDVPLGPKKNTFRQTSLPKWID
jgi:hypothetical protein